VVSYFSSVPQTRTKPAKRPRVHHNMPSVGGVGHYLLARLAKRDHRQQFGCRYCWLLPPPPLPGLPPLPLLRPPASVQPSPAASGPGTGAPRSRARPAGRPPCRLGTCKFGRVHDVHLDIVKRQGKRAGSADTAAHLVHQHRTDQVLHDLLAEELLRLLRHGGLGREAQLLGRIQHHPVPQDLVLL
jgi:hypothetical protein